MICRGIRRAAFKERTGADIGIEDEVEEDDQEEEDEDEDENQDSDFYDDEDDVDDDVDDDDNEFEDENQEDMIDYSNLRIEWNHDDLQEMLIGTNDDTDAYSVD